MKSNFPYFRAGLLVFIFLTFFSCRSRFSSENPESDSQSQNVTSNSTAGNLPVRSLLVENSGASRGALATSLEQQFAALTAKNDADRSEKIFREVVLNTTAALKNSSNMLCSEAEKITLYSGTGKLSYKTVQGKYFHMADAVGSNPNSFDMAGAVQRLASPSAFMRKQDGTKVPFGDQLNPSSFFDLVKRHSGYASGSVFLSTTLNPSLAKNFGNYVFQLKICPQRAIPSNFSASSGTGSFIGESEFLVFGFFLPEEVIAAVPVSQTPNVTHGLAACYPPKLKFSTFVKGKELAPVYGKFFDAYYEGFLVNSENARTGKSSAFDNLYASLLAEKCTCKYYIDTLNSLGGKFKPDVCTSGN